MLQHIAQVDPKLHFDDSLILHRLVQLNVLNLKAKIRVLDHVVINNLQVLVNYRPHPTEYEVHQQQRQRIGDHEDQANLQFVQRYAKGLDRYLVVHATDDCNDLVGHHFHVENAPKAACRNQLR